MHRDNLSIGSDFKIQRIGQVEQYDGSDEYLLVTHLSDDIDTDETEGFFRDLYYQDTDIPGGYFCHRVTVSQLPSGNQCIVIVHHRYDI